MFRLNIVLSTGASVFIVVVIPIEFQIANTFKFTTRILSLLFEVFQKLDVY